MVFHRCLLEVVVYLYCYFSRRISPPHQVRIDTGVFEGGTISMHYDPMIAKLCTHANTRAEAIANMETALGE